MPSAEPDSRDAMANMNTNNRDIDKDINTNQSIGAATAAMEGQQRNVSANNAQSGHPQQQSKTNSESGLEDELEELLLEVDDDDDDDDDDATLDFGGNRRNGDEDESMVEFGDMEEWTEVTSNQTDVLSQPVTVQGRAVKAAITKEKGKWPTKNCLKIEVDVLAFAF